MKEIDKLNFRPFTRFCMSIGAVPSSYLAGLTIEEQLLWLCSYLEKEVIPAVNNNAEALEELQTLFTELHDYVEHYFDNLDVQEEINNKLDSMVEDGTLTDMIGAYIQPRIDAQNEEIQLFKNSVTNEVNRFETDTNLSIETFENSINDNFNSLTTSVNNEITTINNKVDNAVSGAPLLATSTAEMTNTQRIYVNSTDGKWYYYDGDSWEIGGTYQATQIADNSIKYTMLTNELKTNVLFENGTLGEITLNNNFYSGNVGSQIVANANNSYSSGVLDVNENDIITVPFIDYNDYGTNYPLIITDSNNIITRRYQIGSLRDSDYLSKNFTLKINEDEAHVYFSCRHLTSADIRWYPIKVTSYNYNDKRLSDQLTTKESIPVADTISGVYSYYYWGDALGNYVTRKYSVKPLDKINVSYTIPASYTLIGGIFVDNDMQPVGEIPVVGKNAGATAFDRDIIVPAQASYLLISVNSDSVYPSVSKYIFNDTANLSKKITATYNDGVLSMTNSANNNQVIMKAIGGNHLFGIYSYSIGDKTMSTQSDMTPAPYMVEAVNNATGTRETLGFTGGSHGYDNTVYWNNQPTATQDSLYIYADDTLVTDGSTHYCNNIKIIETNLVQASNTCNTEGTGRNVIREKIVYNFDGSKMEITNTIQILEDVDIYRYYGLQLIGSQNSAYKVYADTVYTSSSVDECDEKPFQIFGEVVSAQLYDGGLGSYSHSLSSGNKALISDGKAYYVLIRGGTDNKQRFNANSILYFKGNYTFDANQI